MREVLATEMLEALGVETSRKLLRWSRPVKRWSVRRASPSPPLVLVRLSHGHIRIGTFQRLAYRAATRTASAG